MRIKLETTDRLSRGLMLLRCRNRLGSSQQTDRSTEATEQFPECAEESQLNLLFAQIFKLNVQFSFDLAIGVAGDANATRIRQTLQSGSNIHSIAVYVIVLNNDVAEVHSYPKLNASFVLDVLVPFRHALLKFNRVFYGFDNTGKFQKLAVASRLDDPSAELFSLWLPRTATYLPKSTR